jgi:UDP-galactose transporter B1
MQLLWRHRPLLPPKTDKSLRYIPFPLMLLVKNCKLIPVMLVGALLNGVRYTRLEYVSVALISLGVVLFMLKPSKAPAHHEGEHEQHGQLLQWVVSMVAAAASSLSLKELAGVGLAALNLLVDGFTNSEQVGGAEHGTRLPRDSKRSAIMARD